MKLLLTITLLPLILLLISSPSSTTATAKGRQVVDLNNNPLKTSTSYYITLGGDAGVGATKKSDKCPNYVAKQRILHGERTYLRGGPLKIQFLASGTGALPDFRLAGPQIDTSQLQEKQAIYEGMSLKIAFLSVNSGHPKCTMTPLGWEVKLEGSNYVVKAQNKINNLVAQAYSFQIVKFGSVYKLQYCPTGSYSGSGCYDVGLMEDKETKETLLVVNKGYPIAVQFNKVKTSNSFE